jgi:hypothetical protein
LECLASDGQGLEELRNGLAACLGLASSSCWWTLSRSEEGDALSGFDGDVGPSHGEYIACVRGKGEKERMGNLLWTRINSDQMYFVDYILLFKMISKPKKVSRFCSARNSPRNFPGKPSTTE